MKNTILTLIGVMLLLSCESSNEKKVIPNFEEKELSFLHLRFGYDKNNKWIKNPENILMLHETFKKIRYQSLISQEEWMNEWNWYLDVSKNPRNLIDSLELTFTNFEESPKYYQEFWQRREREENADVVYKVVKEIQQIMLKNEEIEVNPKFVNDTLVQLISFEFPNRELNDKEANKQLEYLIKIGLHESAYNLVSGENMKYKNVTWNRNKEAFIKELNKSDANQRPWFQDDTK